MNDAPRRGTLVAVGLNVRHHVVPQPAFVRFGRLEIDGIGVPLELGDLLDA